VAPICNLVSEFNGLVSKGSAAVLALLLLLQIHPDFVLITDTSLFIFLQKSFPFLHQPNLFFYFISVINLFFFCKKE